MHIVTRELGRLERDKLLAHFLALGAEDRRLRFGLPLSDDSIADYVARIDFGRHAELGVSVLPAHRGRGIGGALLERAHTHARNWGIGTLFMHCLTENAAMMHLARQQGMRIAAASGEADAHLALQPASPASLAQALLAERVGLFDYALKSHFDAARRLLASALGSGRDS
jgi:GNAT superfamily N-acetyltransferase